MEKKKITPEKLQSLRIKEGEVRFIKQRDESIWKQSEIDKRRLKKIKARHKKELIEAGLDPKKDFNI